jgi:YgiT-type zinc finger domain-containing protein
LATAAPRRGDRRRPSIAERDAKVAVILDVPMEECPACGERWIDWEIAPRLDEMLTAMLASDLEVATRHFDQPDRTAA